MTANIQLTGVFQMTGNVKSPFSLKTPTDLEGLVGWWKADALSLNDGDLIQTWVDSSPQGNNATQATESRRPTYKTNQINSLPVARFDGGDYADAGSPTSLEITTLTVAVVIKGGSITSNSAIVSKYFDGNGWLLFALDDGLDHNLYIGDQGNLYKAKYTNGRDVINDGEAHIIVAWTDDGGKWKIRHNGNLVATSSQDHTIIESGGSFEIGAYWGLSAPIVADIPEVVIYNKDINDTFISQLEVYLADKYNITL